MSRHSTTNSFSGTPSYLRTADIHASAPVLRSGSQSALSHLQALLRPPKKIKSVPPIKHDPLTSATDMNSHYENITFSSQHQSESPAFSTSSPYECRMLSLSLPQSLSTKSLLGSSGQFTSGLLSAASVSVAQNTSVPPSLSCNNSASNIPARIGSASRSHPPVPSPYPLASIAPSIALCHATQRPTHTIPLRAIPQPPDSRTHGSTFCPRGSLDRRSPLRQLPPEHNLDSFSSANVSDLNLTLPVSASVISIEKSHPNDGTSTFEPVTDCPLQSLSPIAPSALRRTEGYHHRHTSEGPCKKKHEVGSLSVEHTWRLNEGQEREQKSNRIFSLSRSRDVLEQKQNDSTKERPSHNSRSRSQSSRPGSHRSRSFSTLIQRTRFLTSPKPDLPSKPSGSGASGWSVSRVNTQQFNNRGRSFLSFSDHLHLIIISVQHFTIP